MDSHRALIYIPLGFSPDLSMTVLQIDIPYYLHFKFLYPEENKDEIESQKIAVQERIRGLQMGRECEVEFIPVNQSDSGEIMRTILESIYNEVSKYSDIRVYLIAAGGVRSIVSSMVLVGQLLARLPLECKVYAFTEARKKLVAVPTFLVPRIIRRKNAAYELLKYIAEHTPSYSELVAKFDFTSTTRSRNLKRLEEIGYIRCDKSSGKYFATSLGKSLLLVERIENVLKNR